MSSKYYAVKEGRIPGIYTSWAECEKQVSGYKGALYKAFGDIEQAKEYLGRVIGSNTTILPSILRAYISDARLGDRLGIGILYTDVKNSYKARSQVVLADKASLKIARWAPYFAGCHIAVNIADNLGYSLLEINIRKSDEFKKWLDLGYGGYTSMAKSFKAFIHPKKHFVNIIQTSSESLSMAASQLAEEALEMNLSPIPNPLLPSPERK